MTRFSLAVLLCLLALPSRANTWDGMHGYTPQGQRVLVDLNRDPDVTYPQYDFYRNGALVDIEVQAKDPVQNRIYRRQLCRYPQDGEADRFVCDQGDTPLSGATYRLVQGKRGRCYPQREQMLVCIVGCGKQTPKQLRYGYRNVCEDFSPSKLNLQ